MRDRRKSRGKDAGKESLQRPFGLCLCKQNHKNGRNGKQCGFKETKRKKKKEIVWEKNGKEK